MYAHNINPVLLSLGPLQIRYYGLVYVLGFIIAFFVLDHYRKKGEIKITKDDMYNLIIYIILGVVIGARLFEVLVWNPAYYFQYPAKIVAFWEGGMSFHGGLIGIRVVGWLFCRAKKIKLAKLADILTIPAVFILALGRIANFINGELWGTVTNVPWCVQFKGADGCRHPAQLYGSAKRFAIFFFLIFVNRKKHKDGFIFWMFVLLFGIGRFFLDFVRENQRLFGLSMGQYLSLAMVIAGAIILVKYYWKDLKTML
ncbi:prolipoprotein diacylglyceryl transferase [Candidatus Woesearchaeota archaeon]|nr:prolipoprotein diacylglyceryl transferase [Candidatus Woesearchaeota archaeon]